MSIQSQIDRINNAKSEIASAISAKGVTVPVNAMLDDYAALIGNISGGGGSGIIDVTELPTSGIDENAVYRLTETYKASGTDVYIKIGEEFVTLSEFLEMQLGYLPSIYMYEVDNTNTMTESTLAGDPAIDRFYIYIVKSSGIAYIKLYGSKMSASEALFGGARLDKGATEDIYAETEDGIYTTLTRYKNVVKYFIRENSGWKEISAQASKVSLNGSTDIVALSGSYDASETIEVTRSGTTVDIKDLVVKNKKIPSVLVNTPTVGEFIEGYYTEIEEEMFLKKNGEYVDFIREYAFSNMYNLITAAIPDFIIEVRGFSFSSCVNLESVTFKGKPDYIRQNAFFHCDKLTTINVPWSEGEVEGAPWGAIYGEIKYNYSEFEVGTPDEPFAPV